MALIETTNDVNNLSTLLSRKHSLAPLPVLIPSTTVRTTQLASSLVLSRLASSPTLLPENLASLITAISLAARVSIRASALFIEAILESFRYSTSTGLGLTRRALIAAVSSARSLHYVNQKLDWSGKDDTGNKSSDAFLKVLDKYTNLGIYLIHHTFTLAELFTMSGFYLTLTTVNTGFSAAEESVRMLDSILGSNETSRALSSIITLVRNELTQDTRFSLAERGTLASLSSLTKALTAFACLQTATHRRTLKELRLRVIYDCTVVIEGEGEEEQEEEEVLDTSSPKLNDAKRLDEDTLMTDVRGLVESNEHSRRSSLGSAAMLYDDSGSIVIELQQLIGSGGAGGDESIPAEVREALREVEEGGIRDGHAGLHSPGYEYEIEVEETTTTTTTTVRTRESSRDLLESQLTPRPERISPIAELGSVSEDEWIELPSNLSSRRNSNGDIQMGDESGRLPTSANGKKSVAMLSREETINNPEQGNQRLQLVLKTMTKKFTQRKRTIRRIDLSLSNAGNVSPPRMNGTPRVPLDGTAVGKEKSGNKLMESRGPRTSDPESPGKPQRKSSIIRAFTKATEVLRRPSPDYDNNNFSRSLLFSSKPTLPTSPREDYSKGRKSTRSSIRGSQASSGASTPTQSGPSSPTKATTAPQLKRSSSMRSVRSVMTTCTVNTVVPPEEPEPKASNYPHYHLVSNLQVGSLRYSFPSFGKLTKGELSRNNQRFMRYSSGAYGQAFLRILGIGKSDFNFPHTSTHANNHAFAHHVGINVDDILLSSYTDPSSSFSTAKMSPIINYVAVDHSIRAIVLSCRGSLGLSDILVDLLCDYETIPVPDGAPQGRSYQAHEGMWNAATLMQRGTVHDTLRDALECFPKYGLVLCGHSLGGGVAALLSILWSQTSTSFEDHVHHGRISTGKRLQYPTISTPFVTSFSSGLPAGRPIACYTYGVPCVVSPDLSDYCKGLVISTVNNLDIVSTLSLGVLRDLKTMAMGLYSEQGTAEEIVGRVVGLYQRKFMANRNKKSAPLSTPTDPASVSSDSTDHDMYREEFDVDFSSAERQSGRGTNRARDPDYIDPSLLGQELNSDADGPLNDWLWSLVKTMRAGNDNDKLYPPGVVRVIESYTVFISGDSSKTGGHAKYSRKEGRRIVLRAVDNVEQRFGEPVFGRTMVSDHSPLAYETSLDHLYSAVCGTMD